MTAAQAASHARRLELTLLPDVTPIAPYYGISASDARDVLALLSAGETTVHEWESVGVPAPAALAAMEGGMSLADARAWIELGAAPEVYLLSSIAASGVRPEQAAPYVALGIEALLAYRLAAKGTPVDNVAEVMAQSADPMAPVRALIFGYSDQQSTAGRRN